MVTVDSTKGMDMNEYLVDNIKFYGGMIAVVGVFAANVWAVLQ